MNVEEGMKLLRDPAVWDVELTPRAGVFGQSRPSTWRFATVGLAVAAVVALIASSIVLLSSLQPNSRLAAPVVSQSATPSPAPSTPPATFPPAAGPIVRTGAAAPRAVFDGDCSNFADNQNMTGIAGLTAVLQNKSDHSNDGNNDRESTMYRHLGVITCEWGTDHGSIDLTIVREAVAPSTDNDTCTSFTWGEASFNKDLCLIDVSHHGIRVSGSIYFPTRSESRGIAKRLANYIDQTDFSDTAGDAHVASADAWRPVTCAEISPIEISGTRIPIVLDIPGSDAGSLPVEDQIRDTYSSTGCYGDSIGFTAYSEGAWLFDKKLDNVDRYSTPYEAIDVDGFDTALLLDESEDDRGRSYYLVSGTNYLEVNVSGSLDDAEVIAAILAKLTNAD